MNLGNYHKTKGFIYGATMRNNHVLWSIIFCFALLTSCAAYVLDSAQNQLRTSFASGDYTSTAALMDKLANENVYKDKEKVLLRLEQGTINHFAGNYDASSNYYTYAENEIDALFTKSISRAIKSFLVNDNTLAYDGEDYEDIYLNVFKSLNYMHLNDYEGALVETRRISYKLERLNDKYNGLVSALSEADTTSFEKDKWKSGKTRFQNSALGHYLSTILYAKSNKPDDARISFNNLMKAYDDQPEVYDFEKPDPRKLTKIQDTENYNVLITAFSGRAPIKEAVDFRLYLEESDTYLKVSFPKLVPFQSRVARVSVSVDNDSLTQKVDLIEDMDKVAQEVYKVKEPIIYARAMVRAFLKMLASNKLAKESKKQDDVFGGLVNVLGKVAQEASEKADLRSWQTMPGKAYSTVLSLPPGKHTVQIKYYSSSGQLLITDEQTITAKPYNSLSLVESMYWN